MKHLLYEYDLPPKFIKIASDEEYAFYRKLADDLSFYDNNFDKINRVIKWHKEMVSFSCYKKSEHVINESINDIVANFLYAFNEFLDQWKTLIIREYSEGSDFYAKYVEATRFAFDNFDEYKITYGLRNSQHSSKAVHGYSTKQDGSWGICVYAYREHLLTDKSFTNPQRSAIARQPERLDLIKIFTVAQQQLEQIHKKLIFYTVTKELEQRVFKIFEWWQSINFRRVPVMFGYYIDADGKPLHIETIEALAEHMKKCGGKVNFIREEMPWRICNLLTFYAGTDYSSLR